VTLKSQIPSLRLPQGLNLESQISDFQTKRRFSRAVEFVATYGTDTPLGTLDPRRLFGPPFTDLHDNGGVGVLPQDAQAIVRTIQTINNNVLVA
jgi:hypothetical protein